MNRRFIVVVERVPPTKLNAITEHFEAKGFRFWHWFQPMWLLIAPDDSYTVLKIREEMRRFMPLRARFIVLHYTGKPVWAARTDPKAFSWLHKNWNELSEE